MCDEGERLILLLCCCQVCGIDIVVVDVVVLSRVWYGNSCYRCCVVVKCVACKLVGLEPWSL